MLQHRRWLRIAGLAASLPLLSCSEDTRDITPWSRILPGEARQSVVAMSLDAQGEPAIAGELIEGVDSIFVRPDGNGQGVFLSMLSSAGEGLWGGATRGQTTQARSVAIAPNGDVLLLGTFTGVINLGGKLLSARDNPASPEATFLARFDPRGKLIWSEPIDDLLDQQPHGLALATNADGDAIVGGYLLKQYQDINDDIALLTTGFVGRFDEAGRHVWSSALPGSQGQVKALAIDAAGAIYVGGRDSGLIDGAHPKDTAVPSAFITKLSPVGLPIFTSRVSSSTTNGSPYVESLALGSSGEIVFIGGFNDDINFGPLSFSLLGDPDFFVSFVAEVSAETGKPLWLKPIEVSFGFSQVAAVAVAPNGRVYATGEYQGDELSLDGITLGPTSGQSMFLLELDAAGRGTDARIFDHAGQLSAGRALAFDPSGALVLAGFFLGQIDLDDQQLTSAALGSSFAARLALPFASHRRE